MTRLAILFVVIALPGVVQGADTYRVSDNAGLYRALGAAKPGDKILLAPGNYDSNFHFRNVRGAANNPITIAAINANQRPRLVGSNNAFHISGASHLVIQDLLISGASENGLNIDDDGDAAHPAHHITLRNLRVENIGPSGNADAIKLSGVDDFLLEDCTIERWGSNGSAVDMVGCHRGRIINCTFKSGGENAVQTKGGSSDITVRKCRFEDAGERAVNIGGITANDAFRPRFDSFPAKEHYEAKDIRIEGCTFSGGEAAIAFVGTDGAIVRYNTFYRPAKYVIRILQERPTSDGFVPCRHGVFENNVVVFRSDKWALGGVNVGGDTEPQSFRFANNLWYCEDQPGRSAPTLPTPEINGIIGKNPQFIDAKTGNFKVKADSPAAGLGAPSLPPEKKGK
jgi:hypothetical protein